MKNRIKITLAIILIIISFNSNAQSCFSFFQYYCYSNLGVNLTDVSSFTSPLVNDRLWDFGDGDTSSQSQVYHTYSTAGTYHVCLTVYDPYSSCSDTYCEDVVVRDCKAHFNSNPDTSLGVSYSNQSSSNSLLHWNFGDGYFDTIANPYHIYNSPGNYNMYLSIYDTITGCRDTCYRSINVNHCYGYGCLTKIFSFPCLAPNTYRFNGRSINSTLYQYNVLWDFGDGTTSSQKSPIHTFTNTGTYVVSLTTYDSTINCVCICKDTINVNNASNAIFSVCDYGKWSDPFTWNNNIVPSPYDSVLIYHNIILDTSITMALSVPIYVDQSGSICGHNTITSRFIVFGSLNADYITIYGKECSYGDTIRFNGQNGLSIGGVCTELMWPTQMYFDCNPPNSCYTNATQFTYDDTYLIYPNPFNDYTTLFLDHLSDEKLTIIVFDLNKRIVRKIYNYRTNNVIIERENLPSGMYFIQIQTDEKIIGMDKIIIE